MENGRADPIAGAVARAGRYRWGIVALLFTATVINYVDRQMIGVLKPTLSADLGWSETDFADVIFFSSSPTRSAIWDSVGSWT